MPANTALEFTFAQTEGNVRFEAGLIHFLKTKFQDFFSVVPGSPALDPASGQSIHGGTSRSAGQVYSIFHLGCLL